MSVPAYATIITSISNGYVCLHVLFACCFLKENKIHNV